MIACIIYITTSTLEEVKILAKMLIEERLAACSNVFDGATSYYRWEGAVASESESILIAKTAISRRDEAITRIKEIHSYDTPCIVPYDMAEGSHDYLQRVQSETEAS